MWLVLRDDTEHTLVSLFRCDRNLVESAATEWFEAHPTWETDPPPHLVEASSE